LRVIASIDGGCQYQVAVGQAAVCQYHGDARLLAGRYWQVDGRYWQSAGL